MTKVYHDYKGEELRIGNIDLFLEAVIDNYQTVLKNEKKFEKLNNIVKTVENPETGEKLEYRGYGHGDEIYRLHNNIQKKSIQGVILLSAFFEALINEIGVNFFGQKYYKDNLDNLNLKSKWEIVIKLVYDNSLNKNSGYYENFVRLIKSRNKLVHYKTSILTGQIDAAKFEYTDILKENVKTFKAFMLDLKKIDQEKEILWFHGIDKQIRRLK
jgi:hypothetical protein